MIPRCFGRTRALGFGLALALLGAAPVSADPLSYDDPGMHFQAPDGWTRLNLTVPPGEDKPDNVPAAVFVWHAGKSDERTITITIQPFDGSLDAFENSHESDLHQGASAAFIEHKTKTTLDNGMPAYFVEASVEASQGTFLQRDEYLVIDTQRSIIVAYAGAAGQVKVDEAKVALKSLYVVVYPGEAPHS
jgi:hypothetical protein